MKPGTKYDGDKARWDLVPFEALEGMVHVLEFGAKKYGENNWKRLPKARARYYAALQRHLLEFRLRRRKDPESELEHLDHSLCCLLFLRWHTINKHGKK